MSNDLHTDINNSHHHAQQHDSYMAPPALKTDIQMRLVPIILQTLILLSWILVVIFEKIIIDNAGPSITTSKISIVIPVLCILITILLLFRGKSFYPLFVLSISGCLFQIYGNIFLALTKGGGIFRPGNPILENHAWYIIFLCIFIILINSIYMIFMYKEVINK
jgi:hypothetical protein